MTDLAAWQRDFAAALEGKETEHAVSAHLEQVTGPSPQEGLAVYRNNTRYSRVSSLESIFPVCRRCLGDACFAGLAREYVRRSPSLQPDLNHVGEDFADFVEETVQQHPEFDNLPWLPELGRLEWQLYAAYYRADDAPLDLGMLERHDPNQLMLRPRRCLAWLRTTWPVHLIWQAHQGEQDPPTMQVTPGEWYLVVNRIEHRARPEVADAELFTLLQRLGEGASLASVAADQRLAVERLGELISRAWVGSIELAVAQNA